MPFPTRVIPNRTDIKEVLQNNQVKNILEKTAVSNMVGLLQQLNILSQHASEVFSGLLDDTLKSGQRIQTVKSRIRDVNNKISPIESLYLENPPSFFYDNPYTEQQWQRRDTMRGFLFSRDKAPDPVNKRRERCDVPPDLSALDAFTKDKQPCIKQYSDTDFFMNEWIEEQKIKLEEEKRKRKLRKEQRRKNKKLKRAKTKKIMKVQKKIYSSLGAEFKGEEKKEEEYVQTREFDIDDKDLMSSRTSKKSSKRDSQQVKSTTSTKDMKQEVQKQQIVQQQQIQQQKQQQIQQTKTPPKIPQQQQTTQETNEEPKNTNEGPPKPPVPPTNPMQTIGPPKPPKNTYEVSENDDDEDEEAPQPPPNPMQGMNGGPPPNPMQGSNGGPPPNPMMSGHETQPSYISTVPPTFNPKHVSTETEDLSNYNGPMTTQMRIMLSMQENEKREQEEFERQKQQMMQQQMEKKAQSLVPMKSVNLLAGIKQGVKLNKVDPDKIKREKPKDARSLLMQSLQNKTTLKKVDKEQVKKTKKDDEPKEGGIFEILKRRQLVADSSSEDSGSDWGSEDE